MSEIPTCVFLLNSHNTLHLPPTTRMVLKIYGHASSTATQRVLVVAKELGIPVEVVPVDYGSLKTPEFLKIQPFGQVPYLVRWQDL